MNVTEAITGRASTRAFLDKPVPRETIEAVLDVARWAPSGTNMQPWQVSVVTGATQARIAESLLDARREGLSEQPDITYYPPGWREPYKGRRKACGLALYRALDIKKGDEEGRMRAWYNNYRFFGAPAGLLFWLDRDLETGSFLDLGMFVQNVMLAARERGLATCPEASLAEFPDRVRAILDMPDDRVLVCGMALGWPDTEAAVNGYRTTREPVSAFTRWFD